MVAVQGIRAAHSLPEMVPKSATRPHHQTVWAMLRRHCGSDPLLPQLETLSLVDVDVNTPAAPMLILSPSLRRLRILLSDDDDPSSLSPMFLAHLRATATFIRLIISTVLHLSAFAIDLGLPEGISSRCFDLLSQCEGLEKLGLLYSGAVLDSRTLREIS